MKRTVSSLHAAHKYQNIIVVADGIDVFISCLSRNRAQLTAMSSSGVGYGHGGWCHKDGGGIVSEVCSARPGLHYWALQVIILNSVHTLGKSRTMPENVVGHTKESTFRRNNT